MASIPCGFNLPISWRAVSSSSSSVETLRSPFISATRRLGWLRPSSLRSKLGHASSGFRATSWFNFRKDSEGAGIYGSQSRDDFDRDDVEQYFNYMGMLAVEGSYDKMEILLNQNIHPVDILLMMASSEGDKPKIEELLRAGANYDVKDSDGRTALDRAASDEIKEFILGFSVKNA
ncbi:protein LHCP TRANSLOCATION DEFECT [Dioscorea cayenensis subsp. rotundata]|uniref:Protein LHCP TRANSLOCATION DEFECT n=1 Tax=Dioscorea cayennensis subsp. rotundata TaxID=55577 RepID=A0AB40AG91_DIOCR|nr:protein LHCP TRANSLOCATION DEFECT [Dioscorea cayenensis subsp. rotundata]